MLISYLGHSCFKLKGRQATVIFDPYSSDIGFVLPPQTADIVTVSHQHHDHNAVDRVKGADNRPEPYIISSPGEYEASGVSVFGLESFHDKEEGKLRGKNTIYNVIIDGIRVCHLGDLGHLLTQAQADALGMVDVLLVPVDGAHCLNPEEAMKVARFIEPSIIIPMHYKTEAHTAETFGQSTTLEEFLKVNDLTPRLEKKLKVEIDHLPEEMELVVLEKT